MRQKVIKTTKSARPLAPLQRESYNNLLTRVRTNFDPHDKLASELFHVENIDIALGFISKTLARPYALFFGAITSMLITTGTFLLAKIYRFELSCLVTILSFSAGWAVGTLYDVIITSSRRQKK